MLLLLLWLTTRILLALSEFGNKCHIQQFDETFLKVYGTNPPQETEISLKNYETLYSMKFSTPYPGKSGQGLLLFTRNLIMLTDSSGLWKRGHSIDFKSLVMSCPPELAHFKNFPAVIPLAGWENSEIGFFRSSWNFRPRVNWLWFASFNNDSYW